MDAVLSKLQECDVAVSGLAVFGALVASSFALKVLGALYKAFLRPGKNLKKFGKWAVVTGCTDGIGRAYALALAKKGLSVVLISRTESKLLDLKKEIDSKGYDGVETKVVVCDYSNFDDKAKAAVSSAIKDLDVGVLINNVGVSYRYPRFFDELPDAEVANLIEMNVNSTTWMTRFVLPGMASRRRGAVVNLSSGSAMYTLPLLAQYSAVKSYVASLSTALNAEYSKKGVSVQCQIPFYVSTKMARMRKSLTVPTPEGYVNSALRWIGQPEGVVSPHWPHALMGGAMDLLPEGLVTGQIMGMHLAIRKKGLKKDAAAAAKQE
uniref:Steroid dehydrogenase n=1 Tax=Trieres chinensis TaxID=1514140 RepID=A0A7S1ZGD0_TRICV|eukprot:CAMPEP_0183290688 /NCGR_PEP_ID=MMETSP0160_2-20130417/324_1 /TAXON_ID=2839 ORGANISM="Odontella Sinensis, Strain Grunow 1884" /NCGR_SAMPLE_ID=MMETSP0160_2 /ASSEMBLY_ACC=CAM_ASM_000250 /LENGTH=321 /DNA_ID=CAMNT_0025451341 /DNA_START=114 /DNA_END=1079 /DNA_ORIENTATION=+